MSALAPLSNDDLMLLQSIDRRTLQSFAQSYDDLMLLQSIGRRDRQSFAQSFDRRSADINLEEFQLCDRDKWHHDRYSHLRRYCHRLTSLSFTPKKSDFDALKKILKDTSDLRSIRATAVLGLGYCQWYMHQQDAAADSFRDAIYFTQSVSAEEMDHKFIHVDAPGSAGRDLSMREVLNEIEADARTFLNRVVSQDIVHESNPNRFVKTDELAPSSQRVVGPSPPFAHLQSQPQRQTIFCIGPNGVSLSDEEIRKLLTVGGECCDHCGKTRAEAEMVCLDCCSRCKRAYFCSEQCQRSQWLAGHREHCRKRGEIRAGDFVVIWGLRVRPELNGEVVQVDGPSPTHQGKWVVQKPGHDQPMSLAAEKLHQLRPLK